jgi:hypothetical protein
MSLLVRVELAGLLQWCFPRGWPGGNAPNGNRCEHWEFYSLCEERANIQRAHTSSAHADSHDSISRAFELSSQKMICRSCTTEGISECQPEGN